MAEATLQQIQNESDQAVRPACQQWIVLLQKVEQALTMSGDIVTALNDPACTWADSRGDGPPHLLTKTDLLAIYAGTNSLKNIVSGVGTLQDCANVAAGMGSVESACVNV